MIQPTALKDIEQKINNKDYETALGEISKLLLSNDMPDVRKLLAHYHAHQGNYGLAQLEMNAVINKEPDDAANYFMRARYGLLNKDYCASLKDAQFTADLSEKYNSEYYLGMAMFIKAESLYRLGQFHEAFEVCKLVPDSCVWWFDGGLRTQADLLRDCQQALRIA